MPARPAAGERFHARVGRELVHRLAVSEVFLTGVQRHSDTEFRVFAQWPRWHVFYGFRDGRVDSAIVAETLRQLTVLIAHTGLGVPLGQQFLMPRMTADLTPGARLDPSVPSDVTVAVLVSGCKGGASSRRGQGGACFRLERRPGFRRSGRSVVAASRPFQPGAV